MYNRRFPFHHTGKAGNGLTLSESRVAIIQKNRECRSTYSPVGSNGLLDRYVGNGFMVTWALGLSGVTGLLTRCIRLTEPPPNLPMIPIRSVCRAAVRTDRGVTDIAAGRQLGHRRGARRMRNIIVATDAGREGTHLPVDIYSYLGCTKPFKRLWISSLTDEAIREEWQASRKEPDMTACMQPRTAGRRRIGWWA